MIIQKRVHLTIYLFSILALMVTLFVLIFSCSTNDRKKKLQRDSKSHVLNSIKIRHVNNEENTSSLSLRYDSFYISFQRKKVIARCDSLLKSLKNLHSDSSKYLRSIIKIMSNFIPEKLSDEERHGLLSFLIQEDLFFMKVEKGHLKVENITIEKYNTEFSGGRNYYVKYFGRNDSVLFMHKLDWIR